MQSNIKKYRWIFILIALLVLSGFLIWKNRASFENPSGIYVRDINQYDTLKLMPDGVFQQVVYLNKKCISDTVSGWEMTPLGFHIESILLYDQEYLEKLGKYGVSKGSYSNCTGFKRQYKNGRFSISWNDYPDLPEKAIYWYRIKKY